jgi:hypothetical protein
MAGAMGIKAAAVDRGGKRQVTADEIDDIGQLAGEIEVHLKPRIFHTNLARAVGIDEPPELLVRWLIDKVKLHHMTAIAKGGGTNSRPASVR